MKSGRIDLMELAKQNSEGTIKQYECDKAQKNYDKNMHRIKRGRKPNGK